VNKNVAELEKDSHRGLLACVVYSVWNILAKTGCGACIFHLFNSAQSRPIDKEACLWYMVESWQYCVYTLYNFAKPTTQSYI